jgi:hypothetical protein
MYVPRRKLYESCVSETTPNKLENLVFELEDAIVFRYHDLARKLNGPTRSHNSDELQALRRAADRLLQLKREKLGLPRPATSLAAAMPAEMPASILIPINDIRQDSTLPRITWRSRIQSALFATQRAWQTWVFKSLK